MVPYDFFIVLKVVGRSREVKDGQIVGHQGVFTIQYFTGSRFEQKRTYRLGRICRNDAPRTTYHQSGSIVKNFFFVKSTTSGQIIVQNCSYTWICTKHICFIFLYHLETSTNWPNKPLTPNIFFYFYLTDLPSPF